MTPIWRKAFVWALVLLVVLVMTNLASLAVGFGVGRLSGRASVAPTALPSPALSAVPSASASLASSNPTGDLPVFWEAWHLIQRDFFSEEPIDERQVTYGAIRGLISGLNDPYTSFVEPTQHELEKDSYAGKFGGIGAILLLSERQEAIIAEVISDTPAQRAGLLVGDVIVQVDGVDVSGMMLDEIVARVRGPVDTTVELSVRRGAETILRTFSIVRAEIRQPTVRWEPVGDGYAAYIRLSFFAEPTGAELLSALQEIQAVGITRLILDLRGNRGGLLTAAAEVTSHFIRQGTLLYERHYNAAGEIEEVAYAIPTSSLVLEREPLVVLVDKGTASASEIVAGAVRDYQRGILIGETTYGKGSVQYLHELSDNSSLHVTAAHWLTPLKTKINGVGLTPDIVVARSEDDLRAGIDPPLERALEYLRQQ